MNWEHLEEKRFDKRYKIAAEQLGDLSDKTILDLNCGQAGFRNFIKCKKYFANDIRRPKDATGIEFLQLEDEKTDVDADVIVLFGYGGGEYTGEPLESKTVRGTLIRLAKKEPEKIVIEMTQKWEDDFKAMTSFKERLRNYKVAFEKKFDIEPVNHYHDKRYLVIFEKI